MLRIEMKPSQIQHNARILSELYQGKGISLMWVSKAILGEPLIAEAMLLGGVKFIANFRLVNIQKMKNMEISTQFVLLHTALNQSESMIQNSDIWFKLRSEVIPLGLSRSGNTSNQ